MITAEDFKNEYLESYTWADAERLVDKLAVDQQESLLLTLVTTDAWVGVTMREEFYIRILRERKRRRVGGTYDAP